MEGRFSHSHAECLAQKALHLSRLNRKLDTEPRAEHHAASLLGASPLPASTEAPSSLPSLAESDINEHRSSEQDGTTFLDETDIDASESRVRDGEYIEDDQKLANGLIAKALRGLKRMRKYGNQRFCSSSIQALVCKRDKKLCDKEIDELLSKLEKEHLENAQTAKLELRVRAWMSWFFGASLRVALDTRRRRKLHRRASAASILYCTLNQLLRTEGIQAMSLIFAYACR